MSEGLEAGTAAERPARARARKALQRLGALGLALVLAGIAAEGAVLLLLGEQPKFPRAVVESDFGLRINLPNARYRHRSADVDVAFRINSRGLRADREFEYAKPAGVKRIVSLGDSYTVGYEVAVEECFSSVLERELRARGHAVEVLNAGVSGYSNAEECLYLERELLNYEPDVVLVSFYTNDLVDNVRSGLFALEDGELVQSAESYVPLGTLGNLLNTNWFLLRLSERSNAFAYLKESATLKIKRELVRQNRANLGEEPRAAAEARAEDDPRAAQRRLAAAIFERVYGLCRARGIPLVVQSIPAFRDDPLRLLETFPLEEFDVGREGVSFVSAKDLLLPYLGRRQLYWRRSHFHWTPFAHARSGEELARRIDEGGLLDAAAARD